MKVWDHAPSPFEVSFTADGSVVLTCNEVIKMKSGTSLNTLGAILAHPFIEYETADHETLTAWAREACDVKESDIVDLIADKVEDVYCFKFLLPESDGWITKAEFVKRAKVGDHFLIGCTKEFTITEISAQDHLLLEDTSGNRFRATDLGAPFPFLVLSYRTRVVSTSEGGIRILPRGQGRKFCENFEE